MVGTHMWVYGTDGTVHIISNAVQVYSNSSNIRDQFTVKVLTSDLVNWKGLSRRVPVGGGIGVRGAKIMRG